MNSQATGIKMSAKAEYSDAQAILGETLLEEIARRVGESSSTIYNHLNEVENKLHSVLDLREPEAIAKGSGGEDPVQDYANRMRTELYFLETQARRLGALLNHLYKIA